MFSGPAPSAADVFATGNRKLFRKHGKIIGECCRTLGIQYRFRPSSRFGARGLPHGDEFTRSFGRSQTGSHLCARISCWLKVGRRRRRRQTLSRVWEKPIWTRITNCPAYSKAWKKLWAEDIYPYRALRRELPWFLVGHANYPQVTHDGTPASLSKKWITDVLRKKIGYRGLIVSDDLEMGGVLKLRPLSKLRLIIFAPGAICA